MHRSGALDDGGGGGRSAGARVGRIAVIGAGVAGLVCARALADHGARVTIFDKGRAPGGRLATRRSDAHTFDLGAQYFTARDERFRTSVGSWRAHGLCAPWHGRIVAIAGDRTRTRVEPIERLVGVPRMSTIAAHLARGLDVRASHRVDRIDREGSALVLSGAIAPPGVTLGPAASGHAAREALGAYDTVIVCVPADQALELVAPLSASLAGDARAVELEPCLALGLVAGDDDCEAMRSLDFDAAFVGREGAVDASPLSWIARDSSKPGRSAGERWVLHATAAWSRAHFAAPSAEVAAALVSELSRVANAGPVRPSHTTLQRWRFARAPRPREGGALFDEDARVGLAGDWAAGGRVEGAFLSGLELASRVLGTDRSTRA